jgi:uncharacterized protein (DUF433 family)
MSVEIAPYIYVDPTICSGIPVVTGTHIHASIVIGSPAGGMSKEEVMEAYGLTKAQVEGTLSSAKRPNSSSTV